MPARERDGWGFSKQRPQRGATGAIIHRILWGHSHSEKPLRIGGRERRATARCGAFLNRPRDVDDDLTGCGPRPHRIIRRLARPYSRNVSAFSSGLLVPSLWRSSRSASYQNASSRPSGRPAVSHSWWARVRICSMVGTLIFGPTSLHGRSHNVGYRNLFPCEQEPLDRSRIDYHEFFFLHLHGRDRRGADNRTPGEMARRS